MMVIIVQVYGQVSTYRKIINQIYVEIRKNLQDIICFTVIA